MQDGSISSWKSTSKTSFSKEATSLKGHRGPVLSLIVGAKKLFSGSTDRTIRVCFCEHIVLCMYFKIIASFLLTVLPFLIGMGR